MKYVNYWHANGRLKAGYRYANSELGPSYFTIRPTWWRRILMRFGFE